MEVGKLHQKNLSLYLDRISCNDQSGPKLNSVLEMNLDALHIAEAFDFEESKKVREDGIPVLLKDNIKTADKLHASAGLLALKNSYVKKDPFLLTRLRAGVVILAKMNIPE